MRKPISTKKNNSKREKEIQQALAGYIRTNWPHVIFTSESSGQFAFGNFGMMNDLKAGRSNGKLPDMIILEARGGYFGLILEIKKEGTNVVLGREKVSALHIDKQARTIAHLNLSGYLAGFAVGWDSAKNWVDKYMELNRTEPKKRE